MLILNMAGNVTRCVTSSGAMTSTRHPLGRNDSVSISDCDSDGETLVVNKRAHMGKPPKSPQKRSSLTDCRMSSGASDRAAMGKRVAAPGPTRPPKDRPRPHSGPPIRIEQVQVRQKSCRQRSFSGFVQKHLSNLKKLSMHSLDTSTDVTTIYSSCPDLVDEKDTDHIKGAVGLRISKSTEGPLTKCVDHSSEDSDSASPKLLTVPNVFVTSNTRSKPAVRRTDSMHNKDRLSGRPSCKQYRHSAPDLTAAGPPVDFTDLVDLQDTPTQVKPKPSLTKSYSDTPPLRTKVVANSSHGDLSEYCNEPRVSKITDLIFIGNVESAYHERVLCKLGVSSLVDLSNLQPDDVPASKKCSLPCQCDSPFSHSPATLRLQISESDIIDIQSHLPKINKFIEGAVQRKKKVLVVCYSGTGLSVMVVIQYLMQHKNMNLRKAYSQIMKQRSNLELSAVYRDMLLVLDRQLYPGDQGHPLSPSSTSSANTATTMFPKEAWSDS